MREIWLHTNRRAVALGFLAPLALLLLGLPLVLLLPLTHPAHWLGLFALAVAILLALALWQHWRQPRLAYDRQQAQLLVYLQGGPPERVPVEHVECFFGGQAPSLLKQANPQTGGKALAIIVRLAERAKPYHQRPANPQLGEWQDGYITIRGTWCQPIHPDLLKDLNARLVQAHRARREATEEPA